MVEKGGNEEDIKKKLLRQLKKERKLDKKEGIFIKIFILGICLLLLGLFWGVLENYLQYNFDEKWQLNYYHAGLITLGFSIIIISLLYREIGKQK